jgi:hypothetical protein
VNFFPSPRLQRCYGREGAVATQQNNHPHKTKKVYVLRHTGLLDLLGLAILTLHSFLPIFCISAHSSFLLPNMAPDAVQSEDEASKAQDDTANEKTSIQPLVTRHKSKSPLRASARPKPKALEPRLDHRKPTLLPTPSLLPTGLFIPGACKIKFNGKSAQIYKVNNVQVMMLTSDNETCAEYRRTTVGGRRLRYRLHVMQEPAKARACGSGPRCEHTITSNPCLY